MEPNDEKTDRGWEPNSRAIPAIVLIGFGALFLLGNFNLLRGLNALDFWPVILIVVGALKLADASHTGSYTLGAILIAIGGVLLAGNFGVLPIASVWQLWPVGLIALGIMMLVDRFSIREQVQDRWSQRVSPAQPVPPADFKLEAVFSGGKRKIASSDFRGGVVSAVFGGYELDLKSATILGDSAVVKIDVVFGGVEMKIPDNWNAVVQGSGVFGGFSDETSHPPVTPQTKRLIVKGGAVFGGVVVKN